MVDGSCPNFSQILNIVIYAVGIMGCPVGGSRRDRGGGGGWHGGGYLAIRSKMLQSARNV